MPTVSIAMNPTINGLYPIFLMSFKFVDKPIAAIAIVKKIFENNLTISILVIQFELDKYISTSNIRFSKLTCTPGGISVTLSGEKGEDIIVNLY